MKKVTLTLKNGQVHVIKGQYIWSIGDDLRDSRYDFITIEGNSFAKSEIVSIIVETEEENVEVETNE